MNKTNAPELIRVSSGALLVKLVFNVLLEMVGPTGRQRRKSGAKSFPRGEAVTKMGASEPIFVTEEEYGR